MKVNGYKIEAGADLRGANLEVTDLRDTDLRDTDLRGANLEGANLRYAILEGTNLRGANLRGANLRYAILEGTNLRGANLRGANLRRADLRRADLRGANLRGANLRYADLRGTDLRGTDLPDFQITPKGYPMYGFKKLYNGAVCTLLIPQDAERTASLVGRKCRAEYAVVVEGEGPSQHGKNLIYKAGETVHPDKYDPDIRVECTHGIHFFLTPEEAENW